MTHNREYDWMERDREESRAYNRWMQISYQCPICGMLFHGWEEADHKAWEAARAAEKAQNNEEETR